MARVGHSPGRQRDGFDENVAGAGTLFELETGCRYEVRDRLVTCVGPSGGPPASHKRNATTPCHSIGDREGSDTVQGMSLVRSTCYHGRSSSLNANQWTW